MSAVTKIYKGGTWRTPTIVKVYKGGSWRQLVWIKIYKGGVWQTVFSGVTFSAEATPNEIIRIRASLPVLTAPSNVIVTGGVAAFTYAWVKLSDDGLGIWTIVSPTSAATQFSCDSIGADNGANAIFQCTVTDSTSAVAVTNTVSVTCIYNP